MFIHGVVGWLINPWILAAQSEALLVRAAETITTDDLEKHVAVLAADALEGRLAGSRGGYAAGKYVANRLSMLDLKPAGDEGTYYQLFQHGYRNVLAWIPGRDDQLRGELLVVGAHYDHVGYGSRATSLGPIGYVHNGADDNASGVAAVLELAEAFHSVGWRPRRSVLFALWDAEEQGLLGSHYWLQSPTLPEHRVVAALNLDMIGRLNDTVEVYGTRAVPGSRYLLCKANAQFRVKLEFSWELKANSDHYSFLENHIPTLMFHTGLHDDYHRPTDDVEKLNLDGMRTVTVLALAVLAEWSDAAQKPPFRPEAFNEDEQARVRFERMLSEDPPGPLRIGISWRRDAADRTAVYLTRVVKGSPAWLAGLRAGDRLYEVDGHLFSTDEPLRQYLLQATNTVDVVVERNGVIDVAHLDLTKAEALAQPNP